MKTVTKIIKKAKNHNHRHGVELAKWRHRLQENNYHSTTFNCLNRASQNVWRQSLKVLEIRPDTKHKEIQSSITMSKWITVLIEQKRVAELPSFENKNYQRDFADKNPPEGLLHEAPLWEIKRRAFRLAPPDGGLLVQDTHTDK